MSSLLDKFYPPANTQSAPPETRALERVVSLAPTTKKPPGRRKPSFKRFAARIGELTDNGDLMVRFAVDVVNGKVERASVADMVAAMKWLTDRHIGTAPQKVEVSGEVRHAHRPDFSRLNDADLDEIIRITTKAGTSIAELGDGVQDVEIAE